MTTTETVILAVYLLIGFVVVVQASLSDRSLLRVATSRDLLAVALASYSVVLFWPPYLLAAYVNWEGRAMTDHTPQQLAERLVEMQVVVRTSGYLSFGSEPWDAHELVQNGNVAFAALDALQAREKNKIHVHLYPEAPLVELWLDWNTENPRGFSGDGNFAEALIRAVVQAWEAGGDE